MKDRVSRDIGTTTSALEWTDIEWPSVMKRVKNLRQRIYRATQAQQWNQVRSLMKLIMRSQANLLVSVRRATQENDGKKTPGIDGQTARTATERNQIIKQMQSYTLWQVKPAKRIYIPKANGKRPLGIPCMIDRIAQIMVKNALEPSWEARFEPHSYGFRPGRSAHDAIQYCWLCLRSDRPNRWVLDADLQGAFDNVSHTYLIDKIGNVPGKALIKQWLKAGYMEKGQWHATEQGTPQGGCISPLFLNIAMNGMETLLNQYQRTRYYTVRTGIGVGRKYPRQQPRYRVATYADDFVVNAETKEEIEAVIPILEKWLAERGLKLNFEKTRIVHIDEGFDFLGVTIRRFKTITLTKPQKSKVLLFLKRIREWLKRHPSMDTEGLIKQLNPILRGWGNYYLPWVSKNVFGYVDHETWKALWAWCLRRHPQKGKRWIAKKYFQSLDNRAWVFATRTKSRRGEEMWLNIKRVSDIPIIRHILIKDNASPDNPQQRDYWQLRHARRANKEWKKGSRFHNVARNQNWRCVVCKDELLNGEAIHLHHKIPIKRGGSDRLDNLVWLHKICHQQVHAHIKKLA